MEVSIVYQRIILFAVSLFIGAKGLKAQEPRFEIHNVGHGYYNAFLVSNNGKHILIDSGVEGKEDKIVRNIKHLGISPDSISLLIITHVHGDHVGCAKFFQETYHIPVLIHQNEYEVAKRGKIDELIIGTPKKKLAELVKKRAHYYFPAFTPDIIMDKDTLLLKQYGLNGRIFLVAGHSLGSIAIEMGESVFIGDLLRGCIISRKRPAFHFFSIDNKGLVEAIKELIDKNYQNYYVGHGGPLKKSAIEKFLIKNSTKY